MEIADDKLVSASQDQKGLREILTPEGVVLPVTLADRGTRVVAVLLDLFFMVLGLIGVAILALAIIYFAIGRSQAGLGWGLSVFLIGSFAIRSFYFIYFELRWQGRTPGKRLLGLRVIDRYGGTLTAGAIFARNLTREIEIFLPLTLMLSAEFTNNIQRFEVLAALVWMSVFAVVPMFNRDHMRVGDILAGTWVISVPKTILVPDLASMDSGSGDAQGQTKETEYQFTPKQLDAYGIHELHTLEDVLRRTGPNSDELKSAVSERIQKKIDWNAHLDEDDPSKFLEAFYAALRARLETRMMFGVRRKDKHDKR